MGATVLRRSIVPEQALVPVVERRHQTRVGDFRSHAEVCASYGFDRCGRPVCFDLQPDPTQA